MAKWHREPLASLPAVLSGKSRTWVDTGGILRGMDAIRHDRDICVWCLRVRAEELMERDYPMTPRGTGMAILFHTPEMAARVAVYRLTPREYRALDPDADREMLWGDAPGV
jgi:hypothetical protein